MTTKTPPRTRHTQPKQQPSRREKDRDLKGPWIQAKANVLGAVLGAILSAVLALVGQYVWQRYLDKSSKPAQTVNAWITSPRQNAEVDRCVTFNGIAPPPRDGQAYWLAVAVVDNGMPHLIDRLDVPTTGDPIWIRPAKEEIGGPDPVANGKSYRLMLVRTDGDRTKELARRINGEPEERNLGLAGLSSEEILHDITVHRTSDSCHRNNRPPN
jgi:hypothetical protein